MTKGKRSPITYQAMPDTSRFWLHSETGYTEEELNFRTWVLNLRAHSGIHSDYLINPSSWFADDLQAFVNVYERSWFFFNTFQTRHKLTPDDFHVQPIESQRLQWPLLYDLMQKTGDYLLIRNQNLKLAHLNQPMNFVFCDIINILKGISQHPNILQTKEQLSLLTRYIRAIEKNISPLVGSDRLFLANFRNIMDTDIHPQLTHQIESQLLKDRLWELAKTITQLSMERNRILHFALNDKRVNPHPYDFTTNLYDNLETYPTQAARECGKSSTELMINQATALKITAKQLRDCPHLHLIITDELILDQYAKAVSDLNELSQFQKIITHIIELLGQAGEVYTVHQFKEQLVLLLRKMDSFVDASALNIEGIIHENTQAYHQAIQQQQNLPWLKRWFTSEEEKLKTFIENQDNLAQFPSTSTDLLKTNQELKHHVSQVIVHLSQSQIEKIGFIAITTHAQELAGLMGDMYRISTQHISNGLQAPELPEKLSFFPQAENQFNESAPNRTLSQIPTLSSAQAPNAFYRLGIMILLPLAVILLYFLFNTRNKPKIVPEKWTVNDKEKFDELKLQVDDLIVQINSIRNNEADSHDGYEVFIKLYTTLIHQAQLGHYRAKELNELYQDLTYFYQNYHELSSGIASLCF